MCTWALRETCLSVSLTLSFSLLLNTTHNTIHYIKKDKQSKAEHSTKPLVFHENSKMIRPIHETSSKKKETQPNTQQTTHFSLCGDLQWGSLVSKGPLLLCGLLVVVVVSEPARSGSSSHFVVLAAHRRWRRWRRWRRHQGGGPGHTPRLWLFHQPAPGVLLWPPHPDLALVLVGLVSLV